MKAKPGTELAAAAERVVAALADDPDFVAHVADVEVARRVDAGELIPTERLQVAAGLELAPAGRVKLLESCLVELAAAAGSGNAAAVVAKVLKAAGLAADGKTPSPPRRGRARKPAEKKAAPKPEPAAPAPAPPALAAGGGRSRRIATTCEQCGAQVDREQAAKSHAVLRRVLCVADFPDRKAS